MMGGLCEVEDIKLFLNISTDDSDGMLQFLINGVSARMEQYVGSPLCETEHTSEPHSSPGLPHLVLDHRPIIDIELVVEGSDTIASSGYRVELPGTLIRHSDGDSVNWSSSKTIFVTYRSGYEEVPSDLALACMMQTAREYMMSTAGGALLGVNRISPTDSAGDSITYETKEWLPQVKAALDQRRSFL